MIEKRFTLLEKKGYGYYIGFVDNLTGNHLSNWDIMKLANELNDENEQLKQYKQAVSDVLLSYSQKNLSAKQLGLLTAIMHELGVLE